MPVVPSRATGFALLNDGTGNTATNFHAIQAILEKDSHYEIVKTCKEVWIRRRSDGVECTSRFSVSKKEEIQELRVLAALSSFNEGEYGKHFQESQPPVAEANILEALAEASQDKPSPRGWEKLSKAVFFAPASSRPKILLDRVLPKFFQWFPKGQVWSYVHNIETESWFTQPRMLRFAATFNATQFSAVPESLNKWQSDLPAKFFEILTDWVSVVTFPYITAMCLGPYGMSFVFIDDSLDEYQPMTFPQTLVEMKHAGSSFGKEVSNLQISSTEMSLSKYSYVGRYVWSEPTSDSSVLMEFVSERIARMLRALSDVSNYECEENGQYLIDLCLPQEQIWTFGRIARRTLDLQTAEARGINRLLVFEVADQWGEMASIWHNTTSVDFFKMLFHPIKGQEHVNSCLSKLPAPWKARFEVECNRAYGLLLHVAAKSVWAKSRTHKQGVDISLDPSRVLIESWEDFTSNLMRDLRNTHHGYFPDDTKRNGWKTRSRFLLSRGEWAPSMTFLPSLWLMAFLSDPVKFLGWPRRPGGW